MPDSEFGSDGQLQDTAKPLATFAAAENAKAESIDPFEASEPASAAQRLRAFEDEHLGPETPRHEGLVERGHGAPLRFLPDEKRREHAALEKKVHAEKMLAEAESKLAAAQTAHAEAAARAGKMPTERSESEKGG